MILKLHVSTVAKSATFNLNSSCNDRNQSVTKNKSGIYNINLYRFYSCYIRKSQRFLYLTADSPKVEIISLSSLTHLFFCFRNRLPEKNIPRGTQVKLQFHDSFVKKFGSNTS